MQASLASPIAMASGVMPEARTLEAISAAAAARFDAIGLWVEVSQWSPLKIAETRAALTRMDLKVLDVEPIWIRPGVESSDHLRLIDVGVELGAQNVLVVSADPDVGATAAKFARLCEHAAGSDIRINLEFGAFTEIRTAQAAAAILAEVNHPRAALLVDALHLQRSGGQPSDLAMLPRHWFTYAQFCDAVACGPPKTDRVAIREEAVNGRLLLGEGGLPLRELRAALPAGLPLSLEVRSQYLRERYLDLTTRAALVAESTRVWLRNLQPSAGA